MNNWSNVTFLKKRKKHEKTPSAVKNSVHFIAGMVFFAI